MTIACINCGLMDSAFVQIKQQTRRPSIVLCPACYDEYRLGYISLEECESCGVDFITDADGPPYTCKTCVTFTQTYNPEAPLDVPTIIRKTETCARKLIRLYVSARKNEDKHIIRDRAVTFFKIAKGLPDNSVVVGKMSTTARDLKMKPMEYFHLMANYDRAEEAVDELVSISKVDGLYTYHALLKDAQELNLHKRPYHFANFVKEHPTTVCLEEDDNFANLPF